MDYHAHIYWHDADQRQQAIGLRDELAQLGCVLGRVADEPIGPHPMPMYQASYTFANAGSVEAVLAATGLTVLLHEDTGDDVRDHTEGTRWLGQELKLDLEWLEEYSRTKHA